MAPPQLPLELQDLILSHVQGGKVDLCNCSLVNREWLELSRRYLFRTLVVTAPSRGTFYNFIHLLRGAAHIGDSIETLTMQGVISYKSTHISDRTTWLSVNPFPILHSEDVRDVVERTPRLKTLVISFVKFAPNRAMPPLDLESETDLPDESGREYSPPGPARERRKLDRLHLLNLRRVPSSDVSFVYDVISMFAEIGELMLCYDNPLSMSRYGGRRTRMMPTVPVMPHVEDPGTAIGALEVRAGYSKAKHSVYALVERLRWGAATQPVTTLVWESKPVILEELGRFLPAHATHLRTLDLTVSLSIGHIGCVECPPD
ncbi:hypothetical protein C8Q76DRAFT_12112 [Earliella scabrosa]|nr:hypothetical protein C8Q76DRAFT_12112 [Earliella scabrosa]